MMRDKEKIQSIRKREIWGCGKVDMWKSWRVTSCCISEICQKKGLVGKNQLTESCRGGLTKWQHQGELESRELYWERARGRCRVWSSSSCCTDCLHTETWIWQQTEPLAGARQLLFLALRLSHLAIVSFCLEEEEILLLHLRRWHD